MCQKSAMLRFIGVFASLGLVACLAFVSDARAQPADSAAELEASQVEAGVVPAKRADGRVEEIVVSARKRDELLEDTPLAVSALGVESLRDNDITRLDEIRSLVPNLNFQQSPAGIDNAAQFRIRGMDGRLRKLRVTAFPLVGHGARLLGAVAMFWEADT